MTHYHFIASNIEIESEYLEKSKVDWDEKFEGSKYKIQYMLENNPSSEELEKVYEELLNHVANNKNYDYIILEIAFALDAEGIPLQVIKRHKLDIGEFQVKHLIDLMMDEMIVIERNKWMERQFE
ncbi:hypothetical protein [Macrococcoides canis]|uniref:hypothetical protein n=1 Tax=Macrococcoides canis TaxID=1855823 RepID=UPI0020B7C075|nr:hypothetical protein [Macrococcus canis]UTH06301.1 hypothetical protein KFV07_08950 [Macrococcus canis]